MIKNKVSSDYLGTVYLYKMPQDGTCGAFIVKEDCTFSSQIISQVDYENLLKNEDYVFIDNRGFSGKVINEKILISENILYQDFFDETDLIKTNLALLGYGLRDSSLLKLNLEFLEKDISYKFVKIGNFVSGRKNGFKSLLTNKEFVISNKNINTDLSKNWILKSDDSISNILVSPIKQYVIFENKNLSEKPVYYENLWDFWFQKQYAVYYHCLKENSN